MLFLRFNHPSTRYLLWLGILVQLKSVEGISFHRNTFGVALSVHVRNVSDIFEDVTSYTLEDVKTMMRVISTRFSRVYTHQVTPQIGREWTSTYQNPSPVYFGEAAALVNKEIQDDPHSKKVDSIRLYLGIWLFGDHDAAPTTWGRQRTETEVSDALESVIKSNSIHPGTVQGLVIGHGTVATDVISAERVKETMQVIKSRLAIAQLELKVGISNTCQGFAQLDTRNTTQVISLNVEIVKLSDFIICFDDPKRYPGCSAEKFEEVKTNLLGYRRALKAIIPGIEVMGITGCNARADNESQVVAMREFWQMADDWAAEKDFPLWMYEAFDQPYFDEYELGDYGWWKLTDDKKTGVQEAYLEKAGPFGNEVMTSGGLSPLLSVLAATVLQILFIFQLKVC